MASGKGLEAGARTRLRFIASTVVFIVMLCLALGALFLRMQYYAYRASDTACMAECIESVRSEGLPYSHVKAVIVDYFYGEPDPILTATADDLCTRDYPIPDLEPVNQFDRHTYFIMYLMAPFASFFSGEDVSIFSNALAYLLLVFVAWGFLKKRGVGALGRVLFCGLVISHYAWSMGFAYGQPYPDRLFPPLMLLCLFAAMEPRPGWLFFLCGALMALTVDRAALVGGMAIVAYGVLFRLRDPGARVRVIGFGLACMAYGAAMLKWVIVTPSVGSFISPLLDMTFMDVPGFWPKMTVFLLGNAALLLLAAGDWRGLLVALGCMVPNVTGSMGGVEKVGWSTHYHALYFAVLVWAAAVGFVRLYARMPGARGRLALGAGLAACLCLVVFLNPAEPDAAHPHFALDNVKYNAVHIVGGWAMDYMRPLESSAIKLQGQARRELLEAVPPGSTVSAISAALVPLFPDRKVYFYPQGIDETDYVVLNHDPSGPGGMIFSGLASYRPADEKRRAEECLAARLAGRYDVANARRIGNYVVLSRKE